jgi:hypothetical protein
MTTIKKRLTDLIHGGLAERPKGPNGGACATEAGRNYHQNLATDRGG